MHRLKRMVGKRFYDWLYGLRQWGAISTNNYGFSPVDVEVRERAGEELYQIQLYRELTRFVDEQLWLGKAVLEVGCGRGGGLLYLAQHLKPGLVMGLDSSKNAIRYCRKSAQLQALPVRFEVGDALNLQSLESRFDVLLSVEASHIFSQQSGFLEQVQRVLRPGGHFLLADYRGRHDGGFEKLRTDLRRAGFQTLSERDITDNVVESSRLDALRRRNLVNSAPFWIRPYLQEYVMLDETASLANFKRDYVYFLFQLLRVPAGEAKLQ